MTTAKEVLGMTEAGAQPPAILIKDIQKAAKPLFRGNTSSDLTGDDRKAIQRLIGGLQIVLKHK